MTDIPDLIDGLTVAKHMFANGLTPTIKENNTLQSDLSQAIAALRATQWVPIADVPEEWKDGRFVCFMINREFASNCSYRVPIFNYGHKKWCNRDGIELNILKGKTFVMVQPSPPTLKDNNHE